MTFREISYDDLPERIRSRYTPSSFSYARGDGEKIIRVKLYYDDELDTFLYREGKWEYVNPRRHGGKGFREKPNVNRRVKEGGG